MNDTHGQAANLPPDDQRLLDALVEVGFDPDALELPEVDRTRAAELCRLLELLEDYPVEDADPSLVDAAMARVDRADRERVGRLQLAAGSAAGGGRRIRLPDFVTIAAVLLIASSIVLPVMHQLRQQSIDVGCENNMRVLGYAFRQYARDWDNELPVVQAGPGLSWDRHASNVIHLTPLLDDGYCEHGHLSCPGHESGIGDSYGYQWQTPGARLRADDPTALVLGDRNPLIEAIRTGGWAPPTALSPNHGGRGQNVLSADGSTMWLTKPVLGKDNIWLPEGWDELVEGARPTSPHDVFLAQ